MQSAQLFFSLPWGHGLHSTQVLFTFPWEHRFPDITHGRSPPPVSCAPPSARAFASAHDDLSAHRSMCLSFVTESYFWSTRSIITHFPRRSLPRPGSVTRGWIPRRGPLPRARPAEVMGRRRRVCGATTAAHPSLSPPPRWSRHLQILNVPRATASLWRCFRRRLRRGACTSSSGTMRPRRTW